jgi:PTH1 family peptidyl-tRNA hydrolase
VLVVLDDFNLPLGRLRIRKQGGDGGHNGLGSIVAVLKTEDVPRLRIGIGEPEPSGAVTHVLKRFRADERETIDRAIETAADAVEEWVRNGIDAAMNRYNV